MINDKISASEEHQLAIQIRPPNRPKSIFSTMALMTSLIMMLPFYLLIYPMGHSLRRRYASVWYRIACRLSGVRFKVVGKQTSGSATLLVSNHVSYLDIPILGAVTNATFISKAEVSSWPLFGFLAKIANTLFIERNPSKSKLQIKNLTKRLMEREPMILFAEGTSSPGSTVLPFKSALFGVMDLFPHDSVLVVQPVSLAYKSFHNGDPLSEQDRALFGWYGDMELLPHLRALLGLKSVSVIVTFHDPAPASNFQNRKELAAHCHQQVSDGLEQELTV